MSERELAELIQQRQDLKKLYFAFKELSKDGQTAVLEFIKEVKQ